MAELNVVRFGLTLGCAWGFCVFALVSIARYSSKARAVIQFSSKVYRGLDESFTGSLIGALWAFSDGTLSGFLIAWIYNLIVA